MRLIVEVVVSGWRSMLQDKNTKKGEMEGKSLVCFQCPVTHSTTKKCRSLYNFPLINQLSRLHLRCYVGVCWNLSIRK